MKAAMAWRQVLGGYVTDDGRGFVYPNGFGGWNSKVRHGDHQESGTIGSNLRSLEHAKQEVERMLSNATEEAS